MGFKTHHTTFERACVPLKAGGENISAFFMREIFVILLLQIKNSMDFSPFLQKAQNDKFLVILINFRHTDKALVISTCFVVILSAAKYP